MRGGPLQSLDLRHIAGMRFTSPVARTRTVFSRLTEGPSYLPSLHTTSPRPLTPSPMVQHASSPIRTENRSLYPVMSLMVLRPDFRLLIPWFLIYQKLLAPLGSVVDVKSIVQAPVLIPRLPWLQLLSWVLHTWKNATSLSLALASAGFTRFIAFANSASRPKSSSPAVM